MHFISECQHFSPRTSDGGAAAPSASAAVPGLTGVPARGVTGAVVLAAMRDGPVWVLLSWRRRTTAREQYQSQYLHRSTELLAKA